MLTGTGCYLNTNPNGQAPWMLVASAHYSLSKRTDAFQGVGYVRNKDNSNLDLNGFGSTIM